MIEIVDSYFGKYQPWQLILGTVAGVHLLHLLLEMVKKAASEQR